MALITKKLVTDRETASFRLDRSTIELVRTYSEFIGSPQEHVVNEALVYLFRKDKDFNAWLKSNNKQDLFPARVAAENSGTKKGPAIAAKPSTLPVLGGT